MTRRRPDRHEREAGFSLPELFVVMLIFSVIGTMLVSSMVMVQRTVNATDTLARDVSEARASMVEVSRVLRTARPRSETAAGFVTATATELEFFASFQHQDEPGPKLILLTLEDGALVEYVQVAIDDDDAPGGFRHGPVTDGRRRVLARQVSNTDVFTFTDGEGNVTDPDRPDLGMTTRVHVRLRIGGDGSASSGSTVEQTVRLANYLPF